MENKEQTTIEEIITNAFEVLILRLSPHLAPYTEESLDKTVYIFQHAEDSLKKELKEQAQKDKEQYLREFLNTKNTDADFPPTYGSGDYSDGWFDGYNKAISNLKKHLGITNADSEQFKLDKESV